MAAESGQMMVFLVNVLKFIPEKPVLLLLFVKYPV
jgi:hypothetical protein